VSVEGNTNPPRRQNMKLKELKQQAQNMYYELRKLNVSHSLAMAAVVEYIIKTAKEVEDPITEE